MGKLQYAILGLLSRKDMTGYELSKEFTTTIFEFWNATHSQIYPELKRLNDNGFVEYKIDISGTSLEKKTYSITEKGRLLLMEWLEKPVRIPPTQKDEFRLQLFFSHNLSPEYRIKMLQNQLNQRQERLQHLLNCQKKFDAVPSEHTAAFSDYLLLMGGIMREETICQWLQKCIDMCQEGPEKTQ